VARGRLRGWLRRNRRRILITVVTLALVVRIALPYVVRRVAESQANAIVAGQVAIGDVDLYLLRGGVALDDVALRMDGAPPERAPFLAFKRFYVSIGWLPLLFHRIRIEKVQLDGLAVDADREANGRFVIPELRPQPEAPPPEEPPATEQGEPWSILVDSAVLRRGRSPWWITSPIRPPRCRSACPRSTWSGSRSSMAPRRVPATA
jgi:uncharacterized protein involved in outer membrane biogenesis